MQPCICRSMENENIHKNGKHFGRDNEAKELIKGYKGFIDQPTDQLTNSGTNQQNVQHTGA